MNMSSIFLVTRKPPVMLTAEMPVASAPGETGVRGGEGCTVVDSTSVRYR